MRNWKLAVVCLTTLAPLPSFAVVGAQFKSFQAQGSRQASYTLEQLAQQPALIQKMNLSDDEKRELLNQVIQKSEESRDNEEQQEETLIHKAQFLNFGGQSSGFTLDPLNLFSQPQEQQRPQTPSYNENDLNCPIKQRAAKLPVAPYEPTVVFPHDDMKNPADWKSKYFDLVVVINKAQYGQNMKVYRRINKTDTLLTLVKDNWKVSTGREEQEISECDRQELGIAPGHHSPKNSYFSQTPTGYYVPEYLHIDHVSSDWEGSAMDHAVFFDTTRGIATHRVPGGAEGMLGHRASGACVRMFAGQARELFWMVRATGGPVTQGELAQNDFGHCYKADSSPEQKSACIARAQQRRKTLNFKNELELAKVSGFNTYDATPEIPDFTKDGQLKIGADGNIVMRKGFKTLYVVENNFIPKPVPVAKKSSSKKRISRN